MFAICDPAGDFLLRKDGRWQALPVPDSLLPFLVKFKTREESQTFCDLEQKFGNPCRPFEMADRCPN